MEGRKGGVQHVLHSVARRVDGNLGDQPHPLVGGHHNVPLVGVDLPGENAQKSGFAAPVGSQQAHPLPGVHLEGQPVQYFFADLELLHKAGY